LQFTVSVYDDDTGEPVNLSGITFLQNQNGFTGANWQITDGTLVAFSTTSFTVPGYPIQNQLLAVTLTVQSGLDILAADPITITDINGNATMVGYVTSYAANTGVLIAQIGLNFQFDISCPDRQRDQNCDYSQWYGWGGGAPHGEPAILSASLQGGLSMIDAGFLLVNIPAAILRQLRLQTYLTAMIVSDSVNTRQVFLGELPILSGGIVAMNTTSFPIAVRAIPFSQQSDNMPAGVP
jgi:hypothetical protein